MIPLVVLLIAILCFIRKQLIKVTTVVELKNAEDMANTFKVRNIQIDANDREISTLNNVTATTSNNMLQTTDHKKHGSDANFLPGILAAGSAEKGLFRDTLTSFVNKKGRQESNNMKQLPTNEEILELLKGRSREEKKLLLQEIEIAR